MRIFEVAAPRPVARGNIVAQAQLDDGVGEAAPLALFTGEGIAERAFLKQQTRVEPHALQPRGIEVDGRGPVDRTGLGLRDIADRFATFAARDHIEALLDIAVNEDQLCRPPGAALLVDRKSTR